MSDLWRKLGVCGALSAMAMAGCTAPQTSENQGADLPSVVAAFYPLEFISTEVGGQSVEVSGLTPAGVEPHDLELTAGQIRQLLGADLLVYVGEGFQPAVEDVLEQMEGEKLDVLAEVDLIEGSDAHAEEHGEGEDGHGEEEHEEHGEGEDGHGEEEHEEHGELDPHVWLDPTRMASITRSVQTALSNMDSERSADFEANADRLVAELETLDAEFEAGLKECARREIVTSHAAFGYLADRYELEEIGVSGLNPEAEVSPRRLQEVAQLVEEKGVTTIFFERLVPRDLAETLARETGTTTATLDPIESPSEQGDYLSAMRSNLEELRKALDCE
ncbi:MAG: metal ABC transporter substrate-binding protein [Actinomycetota bacterium]